MKFHIGWLFPEFFGINQKYIKGVEVKFTTRIEVYYSDPHDINSIYLAIQLFGFGICINILREIT